MNVKMNNETIDVVVNFIKQQGGWSMSDLKSDLLGEIDGMKSKNAFGDKFTVCDDECSVVWGTLEDAEDSYELGNLGDVLNEYNQKLLNAMCLMLESFKDQECFLYKKDED